MVTSRKRWSLGRWALDRERPLDLLEKTHLKEKVEPLPSILLFVCFWVSRC